MEFDLSKLNLRDIDEHYDDVEEDWDDTTDAPANKTGASASNSLTDEWLSEFAKALDPNANDEIPLWKPQIGPQTMAFESKAKELFFGGAAGGGKFVLRLCKVLTPFGWKTAEKMKIGDAIIDIDGGSSKIVGIYPHQNIDTYKFTFSDGASIIVSDGHLWSWWKSSSKRDLEMSYVLYNPDKGLRIERSLHRLNTSKQLYEYHKQQEEKQANGKRPYWIIMPLSSPVRFTRPNKNRQGEVIRIDPYVMGLLIGDGTLSNGHISITTIDKEIIDYIQSYAENDVVFESGKSLRFRGDKKKELTRQLDSYGLLSHTAEKKFIPENYLFASLDVRYDLMAGLVDSDGYIDDRGHISYTTISDQLAKDVQHLARSLGCKASITSKIPTYTYDGEKKNGQLAYTVWIQGDNASKERFSKLSRKRDRIKPFNGGSSEPGRRVVSIEPCGKMDGICFAIDHPTGLHVVEDFIVTHNSDLMLGLALSNLSPHKKSIIFRRSYPELKDIVTRAQEILENTDASFRGGNAMRFDNLPFGKSFELGSVPNFGAAQKYKGRPHDLKLFDEVSDISEAIYTFLIGWARTAAEGVPVRIVSAGNPPTNSDGLWVIRRWRPWIDKMHPNPAGPGEIRWYATLGGEDTEITPEVSERGCIGEPFEYTDDKGVVELIEPQSRTFIPAKLSDNAYLVKTDYKSVLQSMPEPYRSQLLYGDFGLSQIDDPWQVIPTAWARAAQDRWKEAEKDGTLELLKNSFVSYGIDVGGDGNDSTVQVKLTDNYVQFIEEISTPDTMKQAEIIIGKMAGSKRAPVGVDTIGVGLGLLNRLQQLGTKAYSIKVSSRTERRDQYKEFGFYNLRSELWWRVREMLDPSNEKPLAIPPNSKLFEDLISPKYEIVPSGRIDRIFVEDKKALRARLGRSPNTADALMMAIYASGNIIKPLRFV